MKLKGEPTWLEEATIETLQEKLEAGDITSVQLCRFYMNRIAAFDVSGPAIHSVLEINPDALGIAARLDLERQQHGTLGPLHGIPILIKDNINTKDHMHTSAGSLLLKDAYAHNDAFVVKKLRDAGAIILGKTNMTEWANFMADHMKNGYSSRGGQVKNPYGAFDVGGSSSGSAAAIACNFAAAAIGTETSGSIINPSSQNNLVGIKPTAGLVSRAGIVPISYTQDTAGPITRTVKDAYLLLSAISGSDDEDPVTWSNPLDALHFNQKQSLADITLGIVSKERWEMNEEKSHIIQEALSVLRRAEASIVEDCSYPSQEHQWDMHVLLYEFKSSISSYLRTSTAYQTYRTLEDIIRFNEENADTMLKYGQSVLCHSDETSGTLVEQTYLQSKEQNYVQSREKGLDYLLDTYKLDAIIFPHDTGADIAARAGYPSITVPAGFTSEGEPVSITFTGTAFSESLLISIAALYEQLTAHRRTPNL